MKIDDVLAKHIGDLTIENVKLKMVIESLKVELHKRDQIIQKLNDTEPELPIGGAQIGGSAAGASNGKH